MSQRNSRLNNLIAEEVKNFEAEESYGRAKTSRKKSYAKYAQLLREQAAKKNTVLSANGALEYDTTGSALVDFNARVTEFRNAEASVITDAARKAFEENPVKFVKLIFQIGDIREGRGERHTFNVCMDWLVANHPSVAGEVIALIPEYTRWDYLVRLTVSEDEVIAKNATKLVVKQFEADRAVIQNAKDGESVAISLLAKWMPSLQTKKEQDKEVVRHLLRTLHMQEREYRKTLSQMRSYLNIIEKSLTLKDYDTIDMEKMSAKQQLRYSSCLERVMAKQRHDYIQAVLRGEKKMNTTILNPLEIVHEYIKNNRNFQGTEYNEDMEAIWSLIPDTTSGNGNTLVIRDGSGSMTASIGAGSKATMLEAASAMAIYCAEHMQGAFHNMFITFSSHPEIVDLSDCPSLSDKLNRLVRFNDCSNTDLEATFDLVLDIAVKNGLSQEEIPSYLMILSDMEFDAARRAYSHYDWKRHQFVDDGCSRDMLFDIIRKKWQTAGYDMPTLVFWQLNGKRTIFPEIDAKNGIIFLSGFSTSELELVMAGKYETVEEVDEEIQVYDEETGIASLVTVTSTHKRVLSPIEQLEMKLANSRYDTVEAAAVQGLKLETA